jgi:putative transposase
LSARELPVEERLQDAPRPGCPPTFTLEQITQLYALACAPPEQYGRPISHWTDAELADEMMKQQFVDSISPRHVGRLLAEAELKPHQTRYWLHPPRILSLPLKSPTSAVSTSRRPSGLSGAN